MLEFITGRSGTGKTSCCIDQICRSIESDPLGPPIFLLLPEHMTYKIEREIATRLTKRGQGFVRCYVYGFKRFAYQILQETGGGLESGLTELGRQLLLRKILHNRANELKAFARGANKKGFTSELSDVLNEFKGYCIEPNALYQASDTVDDMRLKNKLHDLALLYSDYQASLEGKYQDGRDILLRLVERMPESQLIKGAEVWIDGFLYFNPLELMVMEEILNAADSVHVALNMDTMKTADGLYENTSKTGLFYRSYTTRNKLMAIAERLGIKIGEGKHFQETVRFSSNSLAILEQRISLHKKENSVDDSSGIHIIEAGTIRQEMEAAAAEMVRLARNEGFKWRDIGVLIRDQDAYDQLSMIMEDYEIPYFSEQKRQCSNHPIAELIRSSLSIGSRWSFDDVFRCLKTGFFPLTAQQIDLLENYCLEFGINSRKRWLQNEPWEFYSRHSIDDDNEEANDKAKERAAYAEAFRQQIINPIQALADSLEKADSITDMVKAVYSYLELMGVPEQLQSWADEAQRIGRLDLARENQQVWSSIMNLLDQLVELDGDEKTTVSEFKELIEDGLNNLELSLIPPGLDYVTISSFEQNNLDNIRALFIMGANAGVMPAKASENVILSDLERININKIGAEKSIELTVTSQDKSYGEGYLIYKAFTQPREYLWVSYPLSDANGSGQEPANVISTIKEMFSSLEVLSIPQDTALMSMDKQERWFVANGRQAISAMTGVLRDCKETGELSELWQSVYKWSNKEDKYKNILGNIRHGLSGHTNSGRLPRDIAEKLFTKNGRMHGSVTRFERFNTCPFQYYVQYGLKLQERKIYSFGNPDLGTLLHGVLREFGQRLQQQDRRWCDVEQQERREMIDEILTKLAPRVNNSLLYSSQQYKHQLRRIASTADFALTRLCAFDEVNKFNPTAFEYAFGGHNNPADAIELVYSLGQGCKMELTGQIDRVDVSEDGKYFMIMDYKTGNAAINLVDVFYGLKLQLLTYLLVVYEMMQRRAGSEKVLPAAILYFFVKRPIVSLASHHDSQSSIIAKLEDKLKMPGWILMDKDVIEKIDSTLNVNKKSQFIKVSLKKDGDYEKKSLPLLKTEDDFNVLIQYLELLLEKTGKDILDGNIEAKPVKHEKDKSTPCTYCKYQVICGFDAKLEGFNYKLVENGEEADYMERINNEVSQHSFDGKESCR